MYNTVRIEPIVSSTTDAAAEYATCLWDVTFAITILITALAKTRGGIADSKTTVRSHPLMSAITKLPTKDATNCTNCPT